MIVSSALMIWKGLMVVTGSEASSQGYTMSELDQKRNEFLIKVKALAEQYWPEGSDILKNSSQEVR